MPEEPVMEPPKSPMVTAPTVSLKVPKSKMPPLTVTPPVLSVLIIP